MTDVPPMLQARPVYKGMIVPYSVFVGDDGVPDFKVIDHARLVTIVTRRLCGMCGRSLGREVVFIGGEQSVENRVFIDPPMHEQCARYAVGICPFLRGDIRRLRDVPAHVDGATHLLVCTSVSLERPAIMALLFTKRFSVLREGAQTYFRVDEVRRVESIEGVGGNN